MNNIPLFLERIKNNPALLEKIRNNPGLMEKIRNSHMMKEFLEEHKFDPNKPVKFQPTVYKQKHPPKSFPLSKLSQIAGFGPNVKSILQSQGLARSSYRSSGPDQFPEQTGLKNGTLNIKLEDIVLATPDFNFTLSHDSDGMIVSSNLEVISKPDNVSTNEKSANVNADTILTDYFESTTTKEDTTADHEDITSNNNMDGFHVTSTDRTLNYVGNTTINYETFSITEGVTTLYAPDDSIIKETFSVDGFNDDILSNLNNVSKDESNVENILQKISPGAILNRIIGDAEVNEVETVTKSEVFSTNRDYGLNSNSPNDESQTEASTYDIDETNSNKIIVDKFTTTEKTNTDDAIVEENLDWLRNRRTQEADDDHRDFISRITDSMSKLMPTNGSAEVTSPAEYANQTALELTTQISTYIPPNQADDGLSMLLEVAVLKDKAPSRYEEFTNSNLPVDHSSQLEMWESPLFSMWGSENADIVLSEDEDIPLREHEMGLVDALSKILTS